MTQDPAQTGYRDAAVVPAAAIAAIERDLDRLYRTGAYPAVTFCLRRGGAVAIRYARGVAAASDGQPARPITADTPICLFSASKAVTAVLVHKLAEEGGVDLDAPVARYLPAFAAAGKAGVTISDLLCHRAGLAPLAPTRGQAPAEALADWDRCVARIARAPARGGRRVAYQPLATGYVLGEVVRRVAGGSLRWYLATRLRAPLGLRYFDYGLDPDTRPRAAVNYVAGPRVRAPVAGLVQRALGVDLDTAIAISNGAAFMDAVIPSGNVYATAEELSRFYQMLLDGGVYAGRRVLAEATVARAVAPAAATPFDATVKLPMRYSEGFMLGATPFGYLGPNTARAFGHYGLMNIIGWADPRRRIAAGLMVTGKAVLGGHLWPLTRLLTRVTRACA